MHRRDAPVEPKPPLGEPAIVTTSVGGNTPGKVALSANGASLASEVGGTQDNGNSNRAAKADSPTDGGGGEQSPSAAESRGEQTVSASAGGTSAPGTPGVVKDAPPGDKVASRKDL